MTVARPKIRLLRRLTSRQAIAPVSALIVVIALGWFFTVRESAGMGDMAGTMGMDLVPFLVMWLPMVVAMMFPTVGASAVLAVDEGRAGRRRRAVTGLTAVFLAVYLVVWMLFGLAVYLVLVGAAELFSVPPEGGKWIAAGIYAVSGVYQFTPAKGACRDRCRSPKCGHANQGVTFGSTVRGALEHGLLCIGCCAAFMVVLITVGMANMVAMALLTVVILIERYVSRPALVSRIVGALFVLAAVLTPFVAWLHPGFPGPDATPM